MMYGYAGHILYVNLSHNQVQTKALDRQWPGSFWAVGG